jgi:hypothetical protein
VGIRKFHTIGETDGVCFIKKRAGKRQHSIKIISLRVKYRPAPFDLRQILNSTAIGGEKIAKENQYLFLDDINL